MKKITKKFNWDYWNIPNYLYEEKGIKDCADYVKKFGTKTLIKRFKEKNII